MLHKLIVYVNGFCMESIWILALYNVLGGQEIFSNWQQMDQLCKASQCHIYNVKWELCKKTKKKGNPSDRKTAAK